MDVILTRFKATDNVADEGVRRRVPLRMLGKKFNSKRLLVSSKVFMHTIPTEDCDIVLTLPASTSDTTLMWLLSRLRSRTPQISVHFRHHNSSGIYGLYMTASYESLLQGAEELGLCKQLKQEFGGGMKEFVFEDQDCFEGVQDENTFLTSQERQSIVHHMLNNLRALEGEQLGQLQFIEGQPIVPKLVSKKIVTDVFPLHTQPELLELCSIWVQNFFACQPLDKISEYFGVKIGLYFAYLGHYTTWLTIPAVFGIFVSLLEGTCQWLEDIGWVVFSLFNILWATLYLKHWKRTSARLTYHWGTFDRKDDLIKDPRALFKGDLQKSPVTGQMEPYYPPWKRNIFRYCVSCPVIAFCLLIVFYVMLLIFELQEWIDGAIVEDNIPAFLHFLPKVLMALVIAVLDEVYKQVAVWLNNKENHRLEETHETNLVIKLVLFQFVNSFLSLFYIAFYLRDIDRLRDTLAALLITRQIMGNLKEVLIPFIKWKGRLYSVGYKMAGQMSTSTLDKEVQQVTEVYRRRLCTDSKTTQQFSDSDSSSHSINTDSSGKLTAGKKSKIKSGSQEAPEVLTDTGTLTQAEVESAMMSYDNAYEDYLEMCIQFGYVTLFSSAFPLAALCALFNNLIEIRSDAFKLCYTHKRPFGSRVEDIGIWQDVLNVMVVIAVIVNSTLIGCGDLVHRMVPCLSDSLTIVLIVCVEHITFLMKIGLEYIIPDIPHEVALQMAKVEFQRREALKRLETASKSSDRSHRQPDSPVMSSASDSPLLTRHTPQSLPTGSVQHSHHSLAGHKPQNYDAGSEDLDNRGNPWADLDRVAGSKGSAATKISLAASAKVFSSPPGSSHRGKYDIFCNPFEPEVQQYIHPADIKQVKNTASSPARGRVLPKNADTKQKEPEAASDTGHKVMPTVQDLMLASERMTVGLDHAPDNPRDVTAQRFAHGPGAFRGLATGTRRDLHVGSFPITDSKVAAYPEPLSVKEARQCTVPCHRETASSFRTRISPNREADALTEAVVGNTLSVAETQCSSCTGTDPNLCVEALSPAVECTAGVTSDPQMVSFIVAQTETLCRYRRPFPSPEQPAGCDWAAAKQKHPALPTPAPISSQLQDKGAGRDLPAVEASLCRKNYDDTASSPPLTVSACESDVALPCFDLCDVPIQCICCDQYISSSSSYCGCIQSSSDSSS